MTYHFPKKILGNRISLTYKKLTKILWRTYEKSYDVSKIGPLVYSTDHLWMFGCVCWSVHGTYWWRARNRRHRTRAGNWWSDTVARRRRWPRRSWRAPGEGPAARWSAARPAAERTSRTIPCTAALAAPRSADMILYRNGHKINRFLHR